MCYKLKLTGSIQILRRVYAIGLKSNSFLGYRHEQKCFLFDLALEWKPDRGLDHAVEKEKNLKAIVALKDMVKKEPGASLPIHVVSKKNRELGIPTGVRTLIRSHPSIFQQYIDEKDKLTWFRLTKEALYLDDEEDLIHQEQESDAATRLCKFLMMTREKRVHLRFIDQLKWDMGLPNDYVERLVPKYPDYFSVINMPDNKPGLDLVCWNDELAVSELQRRTESNGGYQKGMPLAFPMNYSKRYDVKEGYVKWAEGWQKLPYISPYEDASHLDPCSDLMEKRVVGVLHEVLSLMIEKRVVKRYLVDLKEYLGMPQRFEKCFDRHPGIFYLCSKNGTVTVMLKEAYKRDELVEAHPLVGFRGKFVHLMKKGVKDKKKGDNKKGGSNQIESVAGESHHALQKVDAGENEESMEESSDDSTYDKKEFSDEEEDDEDSITDESSEDEEEEAASERNITTYKQQDGRFHSSGRKPASVKLSERGGSRLKPSKRQSSSPRTSRWLDNNRQTSGRQDRRDTSGRQAGKFQVSREGDNKSKRYGHPSRSEIYERPGNKFTTFKSQDSNFKRTGKQDNIQTSGRQDKGDTFGRQDNRDTSGRLAGKFQASREGDNKSKRYGHPSRSEIYESPGNKFTTFKSEDSNSKRTGKHDNIQTSGRQDRRDTSGRQAGKFQESREGDNKSKRYGHPSRSEVYERPGNKFTTFKSEDSNSKRTEKHDNRQTYGRQDRRDTSGRQDGKFQESREGDNKSKRYGHPSRSEIYERPGDKFTRFRSQDNKFKRTGKQEINFEASQHQQSKILRKDSRSTRITKFT